MEIYEILDRFEILYPDNEDIANLRRAYVDRDLSSIFKIIRDDEVGDYGDIDDVRRAMIEENLYSIFRLFGRYINDPSIAELQSAVTEKNLHSIFRLLPGDNEELRKAVVEQNLHSIFRLLPEVNITGDTEELRKAVVEQNLHSIFRLVGEGEESDIRRAVVEGNLRSLFRLVSQYNVSEIDDLRALITEKNLHSLFRLVDDEDLRKLLLEDNMWALWKVLDRYVDTQIAVALKSLISVNETPFNEDCMARGQLHSKKWMVGELEDLDVELGTVFLCAGWYGTLATMLFESDLQIAKIRSFDIDPTTPDIAEVFNKPWFVDGWRFKSIVEDIHKINFESHTWQYWSNANNRMSNPITDEPDTIINTSCEHIENFDKWYASIPDGKLVILQTNNYFEIEDHINCSKDIDDFAASTPMTEVLYSDGLKLDNYTRFMRIGYK